MRLYVVPDSFEDYDEKIKMTFDKLKAEGKIEDIIEPTPPNGKR